MTATVMAIGGASTSKRCVVQPDLWGIESEGGSAVESDDNRYRYYLTRIIGGKGAPAHFAMLNPSVASAKEDDPTIRRCISFARSWDASSLHVWNLFAVRSTKPDHMPQDVSAIGEQNLAVIADALRTAGASGATVIAAWGANHHPLKATQVDYVKAQASLSGVTLKALHVTQAGEPGHPLRLSSARRPRPWPGPLDGRQRGDRR